jgi:hypothetical protein
MSAKRQKRNSQIGSPMFAKRQKAELTDRFEPGHCFRRRCPKRKRTAPALAQIFLTWEPATGQVVCRMGSLRGPGRLINRREQAGLSIL